MKKWCKVMMLQMTGKDCKNKLKIDQHRITAEHCM